MKQEPTKQRRGSKRQTVPSTLHIGAFRSRLRKTGLILTAVGGALLSSTLTLPWYVLALATAMGITGSILTILTQPSTSADDSDMGRRKPEPAGIFLLIYKLLKNRLAEDREKRKGTKGANC